MAGGTWNMKTEKELITNCVNTYFELKKTFLNAEDIFIDLRNKIKESKEK